MQLKKRIRINCGIEKARKVLAKKFAHLYRWASTLVHSEGAEKPIQNIECSEPTCTTVKGHIKAKIILFSIERLIFSYKIIEGITSVQND